MIKMNPLFATDFYKPSHVDQYNQASQVIFSNYTPRSTRLFPHFTDEDHRIVAVGMQGVAINFLVEYWNEQFFAQPKDVVIGEYVEELNLSLGIPVDKIRTEHLEALHDLGYLPLELRALPEGMLVPAQVPVYTIHNTDSRFFWLTNYFETALSAESWKIMNNATIARQYYKLCRGYAEETCDNMDHLMFQCHDFSFRGLSGVADAYKNGMAHLTSFCGTDTIPAIRYARRYYGMDKLFVAGSIPASEHSVATTNIGAIIRNLLKDDNFKDESLDQLRYIAELIFLGKYTSEIYPNGLASYVSDSYDYWSVILAMLPELKDEILARDGKLVIRPDSGDPVRIVAGYRTITLEGAIAVLRGEYERGNVGWEGALESNLADIDSIKSVSDLRKGDFDIISEACTAELLESGGLYYDIADGGKLNEITAHEARGTIEELWDIFGGHVNSKGYKVLDSHIGLIYGDSITTERAREIMERLKERGFASSNVVFGIGSYTYNYSTRDSLGAAVKATGYVIEDEVIHVTKEPKTDLKKKSATGFLTVVLNEDNELELVDGLEMDRIYDEDNMLGLLFRNGTIFTQTTLTEIRNRLATYDE